MLVQDNRLRLSSLASSSDIQERKYKPKSYVHFDRRVSFPGIKHKVQDPCWIARHGFFPFIHFQLTSHKYNREEAHKKTKRRDIYYASHLDSFIYKYYGDLLNNHYNRAVEHLNLNEVATAYRNNFQGKNNIHFAKEVIDFITHQNQAFIYVADFTDFFDTIDHQYLKTKIKEILNVDTLPDDFYAIFKNLTKYSYIEKDDIIKQFPKTKPKDLMKLSKYFDEKEFRRFKKQAMKKNPNSYGIPQGAGISSVCSNIYLLEFDRLIQELVEAYGGLYRRYCDDLIIVIPANHIDSFERPLLLEKVTEVQEQIPNLSIQPEKTGHYFYKDNTILNINKLPTHLDYLGFHFDGYHVKIREKSLFKYYSRAYKKVETCNKLTWKTNQKAQRRSLYKNYTHLGKKHKGYGNFLTYASRAQQIFDQDSLTKNLMEHQVKNHWKKINARLVNPFK